MQGIRKWLVAGVILAGLALVLWPGLHSRFESPQRIGPVGLVEADGQHRLWLVTRQEEERSRRIGGRWSSGRWVTDYRHHLAVHAHDPVTAAPVWTRELKVVEGDGSPPIRILGQNGDVVWVFAADELLALSARDGRVVGDRARLEQVNPALRGLFPSELSFHVWIDEAVITLADGRLVRVDAASFRAHPYTIENEERFRQAQFASSTWNGGYRTADFGVRHGLFDGRWIGMLSEAEAVDAAQDGFGDHYKDSSRIRDASASVRRGVVEAEIGRTREFSEGSHLRLLSLTPLPGTSTWLDGRFLKQAGVAAPQPLQPGGVLVLHRTRLDRLGRLALSRLDTAFAETWRTDLPLQELTMRWDADDRLLLYGGWDEGEPGRSDWHEALLSLNLRDGRLHGWHIGEQMPLGVAR